MVHHHCEWKDANTIVLIYQEHEIAFGKIVSRNEDSTFGKIVSDSEEGEILGKVFIPREFPDINWGWDE